MTGTQMQGDVGLSGKASFTLKRKADRQAAADRRVRQWHRRNWLQYRWREIPFYMFLVVLPLLRLFVPALTVFHSKTKLRVFRVDEITQDWSDEKRAILAKAALTEEDHSRLSWLEAKIEKYGIFENYGIVGRHLVVTAGKNYAAACFDNTNEAENMKYHGFGTGATAAALGDTALQTECTTAYATDNTRPTGTQAHSTNTYTTVGTFIPDAAVANTEWGLLSQASNAGGTLFDRQVYSAVNLNGSGDSLATTYVLTLS